MKTILLVEDDILLSNMERQLLSNNGYEVTAAYSGSEALLIMKDSKFDIILLDLMIPGISGEELLLKIRETSQMPIIAVSAKTEMQCKVSLLKNGADDYLTKPFDNDELLVRIEAVLRRYSINETENRSILYYKNLSLNTNSFEVKVDDSTLLLTRYEFLILQLLMSNPKRVYTKNNIFENVWNEDYIGEDNAINVHIGNLRKKLKEIDNKEQYIQTVWGLGFKMY